MSQDLKNLRKLFEARSPVPNSVRWYAEHSYYMIIDSCHTDSSEADSFVDKWQGFLLMADELAKRDAEIARLNLSLEDSQQANAQWAVKYKADVADLAPAQRIAYLQEIREPSTEAAQAAFDEFFKSGGGIVKIYQAMIDAKIAEERKKI